MIEFVGNPTANQITLAITDVGSGVSKWKVLIDGKFVPFDMNNKGRMIGKPANYGIKQGINHKIEIHATDLVGNETVLNTEKRF